MLNKQNVLAFLSLFTSLGTLFCCALPALLVSLGLGAVLAGLISQAPWLTFLSQYKLFVFILAGIFLALAGFVIQKTKTKECPIDGAQKEVCGGLKKINLWMFRASLVIYCIGFFFAFLAVHLFF